MPAQPNYSAFAKVGLVAAAYFITGKLGLLLAIPPGYATAVWPPSGIALGAILVLGWRYWPGVWLGSFLTNVATSFDGTTTASIIQSLTLAAAIASGAALQAVFGAWLIRRYVGIRTTLINEREVFKFFILGGPVASLAAATIGVASLWLYGSMPTGAIPFNWSTWWIGDTIGAMIFAPLVLIWCSDDAIWRTRRIAVTLPLAAMFCAAVLIFVYASRNEWRELQGRFSDDANNLASTIERQLELNTENLRSLRNFFVASTDITRDDFRRFTAPMLASHPEVRALAWAPRIPQSDRARFEAALPAAAPLHAIFERTASGVGPAIARSEYFPLSFLEARQPFNLFGWDLGSGDTGRATVERARLTADATATEPVPLDRTAEVTDGFILLLPVFDELPTTGQSQAQTLLGFTVGLFRVSQLVNGDETDELSKKHMTLAIDDRSAPSGRNILYRSPNYSKSTQAQPHSEVLLTVGGRQWRLVFEPTVEYITRSHALIVWLVLAGGMIFSALVGAGALILTGRTHVVAGLVKARTEELAVINEKLSLEICGHISTEQELERERTFLAAVLENLNEGIVVFDAVGNPTIANRAARAIQERIMGVATPKEPWRREWMYFKGEESRVVALEDLPASRALKGETVQDFEMFARAPGRNAVTLLVNAQPLRDRNNVSTGAVAIIRDVTEAQKAERIKREFVSVVSHELRTPLTSIRGSLGLIRGIAAADLSTKVRQLFEIAYRNTDRLALLINDILDIEKMDAGSMTLTMQRHSVRELVAQAIEINSGYAEECKVKFALDNDAADGWVLVDANRLLQVLANLLSNAAKFSLPDSTVEVNIVLFEGHTRVLIRDYGAGIPQEFRPYLFTRFSQADSSDTRSKPGTGLGLAISKGLIEQMGGTIGYEPQASGTIFFFDLPLMAEADVPSAMSASA